MERSSGWAELITAVFDANVDSMQQALAFTKMQGRFRRVPRRTLAPEDLEAWVGECWALLTRFRREGKLEPAALDGLLRQHWEFWYSDLGRKRLRREQAGVFQQRSEVEVDDLSGGSVDYERGVDRSRLLTAFKRLEPALQTALEVTYGMDLSPEGAWEKYPLDLQKLGMESADAVRRRLAKAIVALRALLRPAVISSIAAEN